MSVIVILSFVFVNICCVFLSFVLVYPYSLSKLITVVCEMIILFLLLHGAFIG